ncbi:MAG: hypothetical protein ACYDC7_13115 [Acidithiobacillus ferrivorans]|jgi:hypothetical protein
MKPSKTSFRVIRGNRSSTPQREVFHVSLLEGPPPSSFVVAYAAYGDDVPLTGFNFAPVGSAAFSEVHPFPTRQAAEAFAAEVFPGVPCSFVPWVAIQMIAAIGGGA